MNAQNPLGHSDAALHGAPSFGPLKHRRPPQMGPTGPAGSGQSAFVLHGIGRPPGAVELHVSHWHRLDPNPPAEQNGFAALRVRVWAAVEVASGTDGITSDPIEVAAEGGQSKLVLPKEVMGEVALVSHGWPLRSPPEQVPPVMPSLAVGSPTQRGHGWAMIPPR
jgi:hypothetical protein